MTAIDELTTATLTEVAPLIERGEVSPVDLTAAMLARIESLDPQIGSFVTVTAELALAQARAAAEDIAAGRYRGPLHGIPIALKDLINTAGIAMLKPQSSATGCAPACIASTMPAPSITKRTLKSASQGPEPCSPPPR